jgi:hypothetical protein
VPIPSSPRNGPAASGRTVVAVVEPIWRRSDDLYLFHHTTPESAEQIATTGIYRVGAANLLGPTGVYAGRDDPESVTLAWVRRNYFFDLWPVEALGGVVVFVADDDLQPFVQLTPITWALQAPVGPMDVGDVVVGWGYREPPGSWGWSPGVLA